MSSARRLFVGVFCVFSAQTLVLILLPLALRSAGLSSAAALAVMSVLGLVGVVIDVPIASLSDRVGHPRIIFAGGILTAAAGLLLGLGEVDAVLIWGVVLYSFGLSMTFAPLLALLTEATRPSDYPRIQGMNGGVQGAATVSGALLAGLIGQSDSGAALLLITVLGLGICASIAGVSGAGRSGRGPLRKTIMGSYENAYRLTRRHGIRAAMLVSALYAVAFLVVGNSLLPLVLIEEPQLEPWVPGGDRIPQSDCCCPKYHVCVGRQSVWIARLCARNSSCWISRHSDVGGDDAGPVGPPTEPPAARDWRVVRRRVREHLCGRGDSHDGAGHGNGHYDCRFPIRAAAHSAAACSIHDACWRDDGAAGDGAGSRGGPVRSGPHNGQGTMKTPAEV